MSKSDTFENDLVKLIFNATAIANLADNAATSPFTNLYLSLHTADPGEAGNQSTSEIAYTGYARKAVLRTSGGFTVTGPTAVLAADNDFPKMTGGAGGTVTFFAVGTAVSGTGKILYSGAVSPTITVSTGTIPRLEAATSVTED